MVVAAVQTTIHRELELGLHNLLFLDDHLCVVAGGVAVFPAAGFRRVEVLRDGLSGAGHSSIVPLEVCDGKLVY